MTRSSDPWLLAKADSAGTASGGVLSKSEASLTSAETASEVKPRAEEAEAAWEGVDVVGFALAVLLEVDGIGG